MKKHATDMEVLDVKTVRYQMMLCRNKKTGKLTVFFQGTDFKNPAQAITSISSHFFEPTGLINAMDEQLYRWSKEYGKIDLCTGDSQGGHYATHCMEDNDAVYRIAFDGHKCKYGPKIFNLSLDGYINRKLASVESRYLWVGEGDHSISQFKPYIDAADSWLDIIPAKKQHKLYRK